MRVPFIVLFLLFSSCVLNDKKSDVKSIAQKNIYCAEVSPNAQLGSSAEAAIFEIDPIIASQNENISPADLSLGQYLTDTVLENLNGEGVLAGEYARVVSGLCSEGYGSYSSENKFFYNYGDPRLSEVMSYHYADRYRKTQDSNDFLDTNKQLKIIANCAIKDNAYYSKKYNSQGVLEDYICLGSSSRFEKADFSHDASVIIHEIQHSITNHVYSSSVDFNQFIYDEAGSLNEALSDFFSLSFLDKNLSSIFDSKVFSRWALGMFFSENQSRGAHRCPIYDSSYPDCTNYQSDTDGFSLENNHVSFNYPDGMGWPYSWKILPPQNVKNVYLNNYQQQQIHNNAVLMSGFLYEVFEELKKSRSHESAFTMMTRLISGAIISLPKPNPNSNLSPISYLNFVSELINQTDEQNWSTGDQNSLKDIATERGLFANAYIGTHWATVGEGSPRTPGIRFIDVYSESGVNNEKLNKGDIGAIWFDIQNDSDDTAATVLIDVNITDGGVEFFNAESNLGYLNPSRSMIQYQKINGKNIVSRLTSGPQGVGLPIGNTYFLTDIFYDQVGNTALWIKVPKNTLSTEVTFNVRIKPENGIEQNLVYKANIYD